MITPKVAQSAAHVAHHYDELDPFYRTLWGEHLHHGLWLDGDESAAEATLKLLEVVAARAQLRPGATVYDVGAGYGATSRWLAQHYNAEVTALTLSPTQYAYAQGQPRSSSKSTPTYLLQNWLTNTLPADSADAVIALESTEHMTDLSGCFAQIKRTLRPGGRFVICAWLAREEPRRWEVRHLLEPICREGRLAQLGTLSEYRSALSAVGLCVDHEEDVSRAVRRTWDVVLRRLAVGLATRPSYWRYLLDARRRDRLFVWSVARMAVAYRTGALRYGVVSGYRPLPGPAL